MPESKRHRLILPESNFLQISRTLPRIRQAAFAGLRLRDASVASFDEIAKTHFVEKCTGLDVLSESVLSTLSFVAHEIFETCLLANA